MGLRETKAVVKVAEQDEVVLEPDIVLLHRPRAYRAAAVGPAARSTTGTCRGALARMICRSLFRLTVPRTWLFRYRLDGPPRAKTDFGLVTCGEILCYSHVEPSAGEAVDSIPRFLAK